MNDQPREEKAPEGAEQPTVEQPTAAEPTAQQETVAAETPAAPPADETAVHAQQPAAAQEQPAAAAAQAQEQPAGAPAAEATAAYSQQGPPTPQLSQPGPGQTYGAWGPPPPRQPGGFRRFVGHRATQLVGVGVLGVLVGGGVVGGIAVATSHHGPRDGRPGIHRQYDHFRGPDQGFDGRGFPGRGGGNSGSGS